ncbi:MAG: hypothetical protein KC502_17645 [Myxococcales bacterium]|nr:hypothetical protein [Myxococcales bacterium]
MRLNQFTCVALVACLLTIAPGCGETAEAPEEKDAGSSGSDDGGGQDGAAVDDAESDAESDAGGGGQDAGPAKDPATAKKMSDLTYTTPGQWATPIADFHAAAEKKLVGKKYKTGIHDLMPYDGKLYVGYGDADLNLGQVFGITMRAFTDPAKTTTVDESTSAEEQIDRYRRLGDELWIAGIDATEDAWLGNVYRSISGGKWTKHRTVPGGVHVHDVARHNGALWGVGSGATPEQWKGGDIYAHLWRSIDDGATMAIAAQSWNNGEGDARWVHLLPTQNGLMVFGYKINKAGKLSELPHGVVTEGKEDGKDKVTVTPLPPQHGLKAVFIVGCWPVPKAAGGGGIVTGVNIVNQPQKLETWRVDDKGEAKLIDLQGSAVIDVSTHGDEVVVLGHAGQGWPAAKVGDTWTVRAWISGDLQKWTKVLDFPSGDGVTAIAWWQGHLYLGTETGHVWRAKGAWPED